jgi:hypothetical protein
MDVLTSQSQGLGDTQKNLPDSQLVNTFLGNLKISISGTYYAFTFEKYSKRYMGVFSVYAKSTFFSILSCCKNNGCRMQLCTSS